MILTLLYLSAIHLFMLIVAAVTTVSFSALITFHWIILSSPSSHLLLVTFITLIIVTSCVNSSVCPQADLGMPQYESQAETKYIERKENVNAENTFLMSCTVLHWLCFFYEPVLRLFIKDMFHYLTSSFQITWQQERQREMRLTRQHVWHLNGLTY